MCPLSLGIFSLVVSTADCLCTLLFTCLQLSYIRCLKLSAAPSLIDHNIVHFHFSVEILHKRKIFQEKVSNSSCKSMICSHFLWCQAFPPKFTARCDHFLPNSEQLSWSLILFHKLSSSLQTSCLCKGVLELYQSKYLLRSAFAGFELKNLLVIKDVNPPDKRASKPGETSLQEDLLLPCNLACTWNPLFINTGFEQA